MMRTTLAIDDQLLHQAMQDLGTAKQGFVVNEALRAFMQAPKWERLRALSGKVMIIENWRELEEAEIEEASEHG